MDIVTRLQELDHLIIEQTKPPVTPILRSKLSLIIEEAEAYQASSDKQSQTLARQAETITTMQQAKNEVDAELEKMKAESTIFYKATEFHKGSRTNNQWMPFCPKCKMPAVHNGGRSTYHSISMLILS